MQNDVLKLNDDFFLMQQGILQAFSHLETIIRAIENLKGAALTSEEMKELRVLTCNFSAFKIEFGSTIDGILLHLINLKKEELLQ